MYVFHRPDEFLEMCQTLPVFFECDGNTMLIEPDLEFVHDDSRDAQAFCKQFMEGNPFHLWGQHKADLRFSEKPVDLLVFLVIRIVFAKGVTPPGVVC